MSALQITNQELQASFDFSEAFVLEMKIKADALTIRGIDDKDGYNAVNDARKLIKEKRVAVEKKRNELNADALAYQRTVNAEAKRITAMLEPIEKDLEEKKKAIDDEKERLKQEAIRLKQEKTAGRIGQMVKLGMTQIGGMYYVGEQRISHNEVETWEDDIWADFVHICQREYDEAQRILAEAKAAAEAEAARVALELEEERKRLQAQAEAERLRLQAEKERLEKIAKEQAIEAARVAEEQAAKARELAAIAKEQKDKADQLKKIADEQETERLRLEAVSDQEPVAIVPTLEVEFVKKISDDVKPSKKVHIADNRKAMAGANAIGFLRERGILQGGATEFVISFAGSRPPVDLVDLMADFLSEFWNVNV